MADYLLTKTGSQIQDILDKVDAIGYTGAQIDTLLDSIPDKAPLASPALTGTPTAPTPTTGDNTTLLATTAFVKASIDAQKSLIAEYIVSGSAVTSIDFTGLDINTHKSYRIEIELINATSSASDIYLFINGDTTLTNYYRQLISGNSTTIGGDRANNARICNLVASSFTSALAFLQRCNGYPSAICKYLTGLPSAIVSVDDVLLKTATVTNITQITFTSAVSSAIGIGSKIRIYRGDV